VKTEYRKSSQHLLPETKPLPGAGKYDIYPAHHLDDGQISEGFESLAKYIGKHTCIIIDGYVGVFYDYFREKLDEKLRNTGYKTSW